MLVLGIKEGLVECATVCVKIVGILRNILTCFSKVTLRCMIFALEQLRVLNVRLGPYSAICTVRKHSFGRQSQSSLPSGRQP